MLGKGGFGMTNIMEELKKAITEFNRPAAEKLAKAALDSGVPPRDVIEKALVPGIKNVGERFGRGEIYLPELLVAGKAMQQALSHVAPLLPPNEANSGGRFLIATVKGDIHDIGKNIVSMMLRSTGWQVKDLGVDISADQIISELKENSYDIVGLSTLLTVTMPAAADTVKAIKEAGLRDRIKVMIGGAPVTEEFCNKIGADAFGVDAWEAIQKAQNLLGA
jgi:5-methyltetrahydrofolate--homocysteine methyltransferase